MNQKYVDLAKSIFNEGLKYDERLALEDELIELAYKIANKYEVSPEEFDDLTSNKRNKNGGFSMGYLYSEKVLPIGDGAEGEKLNKDDKRDAAAGVYKEVEKVSEWGIKRIPEKLVRDNIPAITEETAKKNWEIAILKDPKLVETNNPLKNYRAKVRVASPVELKTWLKNKLEEESKEFLAAEDKLDVLEDLGDVLEIVETYTARF